VYVSDIKKIFTWYNLLLEKEMLDFTEEEVEDTEVSEDKPEKEIEQDKESENKD